MVSKKSKRKGSKKPLTGPKNPPEDGTANTTDMRGATAGNPEIDHDGSGPAIGSGETESVLSNTIKSQCLNLPSLLAAQGPIVSHCKQPQIAPIITSPYDNVVKQDSGINVKSKRARKQTRQSDEANLKQAQTSEKENNYKPCLQPGCLKCTSVYRALRMLYMHKNVQDAMHMDHEIETDKSDSLIGSDANSTDSGCSPPKVAKRKESESPKGRRNSLRACSNCSQCSKNSTTKAPNAVTTHSTPCDAGMSPKSDSTDDSRNSTNDATSNPPLFTKNTKTGYTANTFNWPPCKRDAWKLPLKNRKETATILSNTEPYLKNSSSMDARMDETDLIPSFKNERCSGQEKSNPICLKEVELSEKSTKQVFNLAVPERTLVHEVDSPQPIQVSCY